MKLWLSAAALFCFISAGSAQQKLPEGKGKEILAAACNDCHTPEDQILGRAWSEEKWRATVKKMQDKGATLSDDEVETVIKYLVANFGEKKPGAK